MSSAFSNGASFDIGSLSAAASKVSAATHRLVPAHSYVGHTNTIFALGYDPYLDVLISSGKDSQVIAWSSATGAASQTVALAGHYACSMDVDASRRQLLVCGVVNEARAGNKHTFPTYFLSPLMHTLVAHSRCQYGCLSGRVCVPH